MVLLVRATTKVMFGISLVDACLARSVYEWELRMRERKIGEFTAYLGVHYVECDSTKC